MRKTYKFRLYPNKGQIAILERTLETCRILYNDLLAERKDTYKEIGHSPSYYKQKRGLIQRKVNDPYLSEVYSQVLQDVALRVNRSFENFFKGIKDGRKVGYPRFKGRPRYDSLTYPQYTNGAELRNGKLQLSKIGIIRIFQHRPIPTNATIKTCTVRKDVDKWYACFSVEIEDAPQRLCEGNGQVGVDLGLNSLITLSNGEKVEPPKFMRKSERKLKREQRRLSRKKKGSQNRNKQRIKLARIHRKIRLQRAYFNHELSRMLVNRFDVIGFENLRIPNMIKNHGLAKSISDAGWGQLRLFTSYKAEEAGKIVKIVESYGTTVGCSRCGFHVPKKLSTRKHECPNCGFVVDRDWNAALNILKKVGGGTAEFTPVEIQPLLCQPVVAEQVGSRKQEAHVL